jgi:hypothetical protein
MSKSRETILLCEIWSCYIGTDEGWRILSLRYVFLPAFLFSPVTIITTILPTHLHVSVALARGTKGWSRWTFQKATLFQISQSNEMKIIWIFQLASLWIWVPVRGISWQLYGGQRCSGRVFVPRDIRFPLSLPLNQSTVRLIIFICKAALDSRAEGRVCCHLFRYSSYADVMSQRWRPTSIDS